MPDSQQLGRPQTVEKDVALSALQRVMQSKAFSQSSSLRGTLQFIVVNGLSSAESIKEYSIATEVMGRPKNFDPKSDTIVRVQMHRLREKLEEYYATEGQQESIRIVIPRGKYTPEYARVDVQTAKAGPNLSADAPREGNRPRLPWIIVFLLVVINLALLASRLNHSSKIPPGFGFLWQPFLSSSNPPLIVYANAAFLVSTRGVFYLYDPPTVLSMPMGSRVASLNDQVPHAGRQQEPGPFYYFDSYTGSGELIAATRIAEFLTHSGGAFVIKRSRIVSYEDIKNQNVIFLGGTGQNLVLRELPIPQELTFVPAPADQVPMGSFIRDLHPPTGQPANYKLQLDPSTGAIQVEYGLISFLPGISPGQDLLVFAGITTLGTQAAADFATSERSLRVLESMRAAARSPKPGSRYFQALLEVKVRDGVPLDVKCLLVRPLNAQTR